MSKKTIAPDEEALHSPRKPTAKYEKPALKKYGSVKDLTLTHCLSGPTDGGSAPNNKMNCITAPGQIEEHRHLLSESETQAAYRREIRRLVRPGDVVLDLGTGTGVHTLFALEAGAKKVYAVDSNLFIHVAREVIEKNGYAAQVEFIRGDSRFIDLPEKVDVMISNIGFFYSVTCLPQATRSFLKPGGRSLPLAARLSVGPYRDERFFAENIDFWNRKHFGFDFSPALKVSSHHPHYRPIDLAKFVAPPSPLPLLHFAEFKGSLAFEFETIIASDGPVHGLAGWYDFFSDAGMFLSLSPPLESKIWNHFILPFAQPLQAKANERWTVKIEAQFPSADQTSIWNWTVESQNQTKISQSSFASLLPDFPVFA